MSISLETAAQTDKGLKREQNEDNVLTTLPQDSETMQKKGALFVVADGLGGHSKGEVASALVVNTVNASYYQDTDHDISTALREAVTHANSSVYQENATEEQDEKRFMGATCIAVVLHDTHAYVANVGDSRAYVIRQGTIKQLTIDHSWVAEQVQAGTLTL